MLKAHRSLSSSFPRDVTDNAHINSEISQIMSIETHSRDADCRVSQLRGNLLREESFISKIRNKQLDVQK